MKMKNVFFVIAVCFSLFSISSFCLAQVKIPTSQELNGLSDKTIRATIEDVIKAVIVLVGSLSLLMIVIGGVMYVISGDDRSKVETATQIVIYAVTGLVVSLVSYTIVITVFNVLGAG